MEDGHLIPDEEVWYVADTIPNGSVAAILVLEHLWAIPFETRSLMPVAWPSPTSGSTPAIWSPRVGSSRRVALRQRAGGVELFEAGDDHLTRSEAALNG